ATRIREEVDQDANIIVGATFDESLDGIIRVSVVATGIEQALLARNAAAPSTVVTNAVSPDTRLADLTAKLRADNQRTVAAQAAAPAQAPAANGQRPTSTHERAALAAIAAAVSPEKPMQSAAYGDVTVRPIAQKPSLFPEHDVIRQEAHEPAPPEQFIPQAAERAPMRAPRMPKFEDLPMPAQNEIRQARGETDDEQHPQKARLSLLQRLANVGLGRREETEAEPVRAPQMAPIPPLPERKPQRSVAQQMGHDPVSEYARRPAPQGLDSHGRPAPVAPAPQGDDHLDIPAFLRRQSN
ncbi:MAG: cell division protein FtsZ, partial [Tardiphaga sp.]|nr:cell division protein FtsZ [Tardiphaga sp.]